MEDQGKTIPRGIFFDMDGTLLLTTQAAGESWLHVFRHFEPCHHQSPERLGQTMHDVYHMYKQSIANDESLQQWDRFHPFEVRKQLVEQVLAHANISDEALTLSMVKVYEAQRDHYRCLTPSALETLQKLRQKGVRLALLTNGNATYQRRKIAQYHLAPLFDGILIEEEYGFGKPDPRIYQEALARLCLTAPKTWMVGDNLRFDIEASQQLGIFACWFDPYRQGLSPQTKIHPDRILHTLPEILQGWEDGKPTQLS